MGWFVEGADEVYRALRREDVGMVDQFGKRAEGDDPPRSAGSGTMTIFFTVPEEAGLRHEFLPEFPFKLNHRIPPAWKLPPASPHAPAALDRHPSHPPPTHTPP